jgi:hypothetical protein
MTSEKPLGIIVEINPRDRLSGLEVAAKKLGDISLRVIDDPNEALEILRAQVIALSRVKHPGEPEEKYERLAAVTWPEGSIDSCIGSEAVNAVTEITFYDDHTLMDLHVTARYGDTFGFTQI